MEELLINKRKSDGVPNAQSMSLNDAILTDHRKLVWPPPPHVFIMRQIMKNEPMRAFPAGCKARRA